MVSILAFDNRSMKHLLGDHFAEHFSDEYPLFFKNKLVKGEDIFYYTNAIENAIKLDLARSVEAICNYLVKYQNSFVSQNLYFNCFTDLVRKNINIKPLLDSNIFRFEFEFDGWPS